MLWLETLQDFSWDGEPVVWISQSQGQTRDALVRALASRVLGVAEDRIQMERAASGQRHISAPQPLWLSSASRGDWNAIAIARHPIGVDIEIRPAGIPVPFDLLHPAERDCLMALTDNERELAFLRFWTAREAYWKSLGRGLDAALAGSRAEIGGKDRIAIHVQGNSAAIAQTLVTDRYVAAIVSAPGLPVAAHDGRIAGDSPARSSLCSVPAGSESLSSY